MSYSGLHTHMIKNMQLHIHMHASSLTHTRAHARTHTWGEAGTLSERNCLSLAYLAQCSWQSQPCRCALACQAKDGYHSPIEPTSQSENTGSKLAQWIKVMVKPLLPVCILLPDSIHFMRKKKTSMLVW